MPGAVRRAERYLAAQLLAGHITKTASQSPRRWLSNENSYPAKPSAPAGAAADKAAGAVSPRLADAVPALLAPGDQPASSGSPTFAAPVLRPAPPLHPIGEHEVRGPIARAWRGALRPLTAVSGACLLLWGAAAQFQWAHPPTVQFPIEWDPSLGGGGADHATFMQALMAKGVLGPLTPPQHEVVTVARWPIEAAARPSSPEWTSALRTALAWPSNCDWRWPRTRCWRSS